MKENSNFHQEAEKFFLQLDMDKHATESAYEYIVKTINEALSISNMDLLLSLIPYIENGEGKLPYKYIGETARLLRILHIIQLECHYKKNLFSTDCPNKEHLMEKYMLSLFALRRLLFHLSSESSDDAASFLYQSRLSVFAVYIIIKDDLILPTRTLYEDILKIYSDVWNENDISLFCSMIQSDGSV